MDTLLVKDAIPLCANLPRASSQDSQSPLEGTVELDTDCVVYILAAVDVAVCGSAGPTDQGTVQCIGVAVGRQVCRTGCECTLTDRIQAGGT